MRPAFSKIGTVLRIGFGKKNTSGRFAKGWAKIPIRCFRAKIGKKIPGIVIYLKKKRKINPSQSPIDRI